MEGDGNFQNFNKLGGANKLKWVEKNLKFGNWPPKIRDGRVDAYKSDKKVMKVLI